MELPGDEDKELFDVTKSVDFSSPVCDLDRLQENCPALPWEIAMLVN